MRGHGFPPGMLKQRSKKAGLAPGTLVHIGEKKQEATRITLIDYDQDRFEEREAEVKDCVPIEGATAVRWINVSGVSRLDIIEEIGKQFHLHPLLLEDIANTDQRPKLDDYTDYLFVVLKMLYREGKNDAVIVEQVSLVFGPRYVISFQENGRDVFDPVRDRLRTGKGRIRGFGADYLVYSLIDAIVDQYFVILETLGERIERMDEQLIARPKPATLSMIHGVKRELLFLRKAVWPLREVINVLQRGESPLVKDATRIYLRDVYDHAMQVIDTIEAFREMTSVMMEVYMSSISYRINTVMKVLAVITTIFMPLTFIAGVYGMNFKYMPELDWRWGYPAVLAVMASVVVVMLVYFRKKEWL
jgi:magnesium transporter